MQWINQTFAELGLMEVGAAPTAHTIASHSDTTGTGTELNTLTDGSNADALHSHSAGASALNDLSDVTITASATGDMLRYNGSAYVDVLETTLSVAEAAAWTTGRTITLSGDVSGTSPAWDGSGNLAFINTVVANDSHTHSIYLQDITAEALSTLSDVTITTIASGELLMWNGSAWINRTLVEAGIVKYTDGEAVSAMGILGDSNALNHTRYTDGEATSAVGTPWIGLIAAEDHHTKYTDGEAVSAMGILGDANDLNHNRYTDTEAAAKISADALYMLTGAAPNAHTVASHSDTTATGTELETLTDGSNADALHSHTGGSADIDNLRRLIAMGAF